MVLIWLYSIATALLFTHIEPLKVIGVFLSFCYLPGLSFILLGKRNNLLFEDIILAFPFSIAFSCIFTLLILLFGFHVKHVSVIVHVIVGITIIIYGIITNKNRIHLSVKISNHEKLFCLFGFLIIILLSVPFFLGPNRLAISAHAFHHSLLTTQIMNGIFPPENPGLGGTIIGYYWGFHALIAALTFNTNYHQLQMAFILNTLSLYIIFCISYLIAKTVNLSEIYRYLLPLTIIGLMKFDAGILFLWRLISGSLIPFNALTASPLEPYDVLLSWINGLLWFDSRLFTLHKLYNVSGMLLALSLCYAYLNILLKRGLQLSKPDMAGIALIIFACLFIYPPLAIFLLVHAPAWACYVFLSNGGNLKEQISQTSRILIPYILAVLFAAPYMFYVISGRAVSSGDQGGIFSFDFYGQSLKNMAVFMFSLPIIVYGIYAAIKRFSFSKEIYFLLIGTALCLILTVFTRWPFDNSYKYNYILTIFFSLFFLIALADILDSFERKWFKRLILTTVIVLLSLTPLIVESSYIVSSFSTDRIYLFSGRRIIYAGGEIKNDAYRWIRNNTPANAFLMLSYIETNLPCCGINNNYIAGTIAERTLYVIKDKDYTVSNPEYEKRVEFRERLFTAPNDPQVIDFFNSLNRQVYLLVEEGLDKEMFFIEDRFKHFPEDPGWPFVLKFKNKMQRVYLIDVNME